MTDRNPLPAGAVDALVEGALTALDASLRRHRQRRAELWRMPRRLATAPDLDDLDETSQAAIRRAERSLTEPRT